MKLLTLTGLCIAFASFAVAQDQATKPSTAQTDKHDAAAMTSTKAFLTEAAEGAVAEVELGQLASQKAANDKVKSFGQQMVTDHGAANTELKQLADRKQVTLPTAMGRQQKIEHDRLSKLSGSAFDRAYVNLMVSDHQKDVAEFKKQSTQSTDADVKAFAAKTLPTLEQHLSLIQVIQKELQSGSTRSN